MVVVDVKLLPIPVVTGGMAAFNDGCIAMALR